jgi:hypothetical protein
MGTPVTMGAMLQCTQGIAPSSFMVADPVRPTIENKPAGVITDNIPMANIMPFGMCNSLANPTVAAATSAALGVLTPMPCVPFTVAPWTPGSTVVSIGGRPALTDSSSCMCNWAGQISVKQPGPMTTDMA